MRYSMFYNKKIISHNKLNKYLLLYDNKESKKTY